MERQYTHLAITALIAFGGLIAVMLFAKYDHYANVMAAIFFAGSVGAVVNNYFRLSRIAAHPDTVRAELERSAVTIQMYVSLLLSGILGFVAYGLFLSNLLQGELFPKFSNLECNYSTFEDLLDNVFPETNGDAIKAIFWAFMAGFSERFIPNILDTIVTKAEAGG